MTMYLGDIPLGAVIPVPFAAFSSAGASITLTGLAVTDIEVYKGASMTQRASDAGYTLMDTDGIDLDGVTGIHGFSIDTGDNTDAGFFVAGSFYWVVVASVTIDSQTVNFIPVMWRMVAAENTAGTRVVDTVRVAGTAQTPRDIGASVLLSSGTGTGQVSLASGILKVDVDTIKTNPVVNGGTVTFPTGATLASTTNITGGTITTVTNLTNAPTAGDFTATMKTSIGTAVAASAVASVTGNVGGNVAGSVGSVAAGGITASSIAADAIGASELASDAVAEIAGAVWDITLASHLTGGTTGAALNAAGSAGDPWSTTLPGAYIAGSAGYIIGTNVNATLSSRASQTSVDDLPTNAELATALGTADDAVLAAIADIPTANENADALLKRDWTAVTGEAARSVLNALRFLRNKWSISGGTLTVTAEDDTTTAWTGAVTTTAGDPVSTIDPT